MLWEKKKVKCPYCHKTLEKKPIRKSKCPNCNQYMYVRNNKLVTEERAKVIDEKRKIEREKSYIINQLEELQISEEDFYRLEKNIMNKSGKKPHYADVILRLFQEYRSKNKAYRESSGSYYSMALFLNREKRECLPFLSLSAKMKLKEYQAQEFIDKVMILTAGEQSCPSCQKLDGKIFTIEEALKIMPLPNKNCTFHLYDEKKSFCRCSYTAEVESI